LGWLSLVVCLSDLLSSLSLPKHLPPPPTHTHTHTNTHRERHTHNVATVTHAQNVSRVGGCTVEFAEYSTALSSCCPSYLVGPLDLLSFKYISWAVQHVASTMVFAGGGEGGGHGGLGGGE